MMLKRTLTTIVLALLSSVSCIANITEDEMSDDEINGIGLSCLYAVEKHTLSPEQVAAGDTKDTGRLMCLWMMAAFKDEQE